MSTVSPLKSFIQGAPQRPWKQGEITSSTADVQITDIPSNAITVDVFITNIVPTSDARAVYMRTSSDNGASFDSAASNYSYTGRYLNSGALYGYNSSAANTFIYLSHNAIGLAANETWNQRVRLFNPGGAGNYTKILTSGMGTNSSTQAAAGFGGGCREAAEKVNAIQFFMNVGNFASLKWKAYLNL
jgi:hypothetical protein